MNPDVLTAMILAGLTGAGVGYGLGRYLGGGWLLAFNLLLAATMVVLLSSPILEMLGIERAGMGHLGYIAFALFIVVPAFCGSLLLGGVGLYRAARLRRVREASQ